MNIENPSSHFSVAQLVSRGWILDIFVFIVNLFLMRLLVEYFLDVVYAAKKGDSLSVFTITVFLASLLVLAPVGSFLSRWHFNERRESVGANSAGGCLFNPLIYFGVVVIIFSVSTGLTTHLIFGTSDLGEAWRIALIVVGLSFAALHTFVVYRYFSPGPRPRSAFLLSPLSGLIGDICIFVNMLFFQILWNTLALGFRRPMDGYDLFTNLLAVIFGGLLMYFPPRIFYLAEDIKKPRTWFFIIFANLPVIYRAMFGSGHALNF
jgi:hypothetical protein